jgi:hypothetical protein
MKHKSPSSELLAAEIGTENLENPFYNNDQPPIMENETTEFSTEDWSCFSEGFSDMDMVLPYLTNQGLLHEIPLVFHGLVNQGLSSEIIAAEAGTENLEYTFFNNDQLRITENKTTNCSSEDCTVFSKVFSDTHMVLPGQINQGVDDEIPRDWNMSPFFDMYDLAGVYK